MFTRTRVWSGLIVLMGLAMGCGFVQMRKDEGGPKFHNPLTFPLKVASVGCWDIPRKEGVVGVLAGIVMCPTMVLGAAVFVPICILAPPGREHGDPCSAKFGAGWVVV